MKILFMAALVLVQTKWPNEKFRIEIYNSQKQALKYVSVPAEKWNYERTLTHNRSLSNHALRKADSALKANGAEPFKDSLSVVSFFQIEGYNAGMIWRDSTKIFTWIFNHRFYFKMKTMYDLTTSQRKIVREASTPTDSFFLAKRPTLGQEHGHYTSLTKWYAPDLKKQTVTYFFFVPPGINNK